MNRNLFWKEFKRNAAGLAVWTAAITLLVTATMAVYPTFLENRKQVMGFLSLIPKGALQFKGIANLDDLLSVLGFYAGNNGIFLMLLGSVFAITLSANILLKEEYHRTAEFLMARPLTRSRIFFSKVAVVFLNLLLLNLVVSSVGLAEMHLVQAGPVPPGPFLTLSLYTFLLNVLFAAAGIFLSTLVRRPRPITTFCIGLVLILYFINTISKITENVSDIGYISPFRYVPLNVTEPGYGPEWGRMAYFLGLIAVFGVMGYRLYRRKDVYT
jgi:ABC-2 type transport system permease protein